MSCPQFLRLRPLASIKPEAVISDQDDWSVVFDDFLNSSTTSSTAIAITAPCKLSESKLTMTDAAPSLIRSAAAAESNKNVQNMMDLLSRVNEYGSHHRNPC